MAQTANFFTLENTVKLTVLSAFFVGIITYLTDIKQDIALIKQASIYEVKGLAVNHAADLSPKLTPTKVGV